MTIKTFSQSYPQTYGGDHFYQGPPRPPEAYVTQPPYQGCYSGQSGATFSWDGPKTHGNTSKPPGGGTHALTIFLKLQNIDFTFIVDLVLGSSFLCQCS